MQKISVVLAVYNEENNLRECLASVKHFASEIVIVDGGSTDQTVEIARQYKAKIIITNNPPIFHINKQKALDKASGDWILQLDADERVTPKLAQEIRSVIAMSDEEIKKYQEDLSKKRLFLKHQKLIEKRDGKVGSKNSSYTAFFIPRLNYFLGKYLTHGGIYPDGVIRLVKKGQAFFPCQSVHEQITVLGNVGWLENDLLHFADPTFKRYLERNNRYINLIRDELISEKIGKDIIQFINYIFIKPIFWFGLTLFRHKGILDGYQGVVFSFFSALRFPRAYLRYLKSN